MTTLLEAIRLKANGVYRYRGDASKVIAAIGKNAPRHVRLKGLRDKAQFIEQLGKALGFPEYSAKNWDAFEESLGEIEMPSEAGLLIELDSLKSFSELHPDDLETALAILADAAQSWQDSGHALWILVDGAGAAAQDLDMLTAT